MLNKSGMPFKLLMKALTRSNSPRLTCSESNINFFKMKEGETIQDMNTRFIVKTDEVTSLGKIISINKCVRKLPSILTISWESK